MKITSISSETVSQEVLGTRAYMAANSAMQAELQVLFPLNTVGAGTCNTTNSYPLKTALSEDIPGLYDCWANTACAKYYTDSDTNVVYYRLTSTGKCGSGEMEVDSRSLVTSSRTIQVEARSL